MDDVKRLVEDREKDVVPVRAIVYYMVMLNIKPNTLFIADNIDILKGINSECVDLIATDPPFATGKGFVGAVGTQEEGKEWKDQFQWCDYINTEHSKALKKHRKDIYKFIVGVKAHNEPMGAYLLFMSVRLIEMHRILKPTGSLYLHCDTTANSYLRVLLDMIFKVKRPKNEIIWQRLKSRSDGKHWGNVNDTILFYTKTDTYTWNDTLIAKQRDQQKLQTSSLTARDINKNDKAWRGYHPATSGHSWCVAKTGKYAEWIEKYHIPNFTKIEDMYERLELLQQHGFIHWSKNNIPRLIYKKEYLVYKKINNIWADIGLLQANTKERIAGGRGTQKPRALYRRIIEASTNEGDVVLDAFAGCSTTLLASVELNRKCIGIDIENTAYVTIEQQFNELASNLLAPQEPLTTTSTMPVRTDTQINPYLIIEEYLQKNTHIKTINLNIEVPKEALQQEEFEVRIPLHTIVNTF